MLHTTFKHNLRTALKSRGLSMKTISHKAGYNYAYVRKVVSGSKTNPTLQFVESIAQAIGVSPQELLKDIGDHIA